MAVQRAGGLVGQQQLGVIDDGPGAGTPLLLASGHMVGVLIQDVPDIQLLGHLPDAGLHLTGGRSIDGQRQGDILGDGQGIQQIEVLEDKAQVFPTEPGQGFGPQLRHVRPVLIDVAGADGVNGGDAVEQGGLAGAGGSHDPQELPFRDGKADVLDGLRDISPVAVVFLDVLQLQDRLHVSCLPCSFLAPIVPAARPLLYQLFFQSSYKNVRSAEPVSSAPL